MKPIIALAVAFRRYITLTLLALSAPSLAVSAASFDFFTKGSPTEALYGWLLTSSPFLYVSAHECTGIFVQESF